MVSDPRRTDAAIDWLIRQRDPAFTGWAEFTEWLEADRRNADAYAELANRDEAVAERLIEAPAAGELAAPEQPRRFSRRAAIGGLTAMAAALALAFGTFQLRPEPSLYQVATAPGVQKTVTLAGGSSINLNGATRITLDRENARFAILEQGEAQFSVIHDESDPFRVRVGGAELVDIGTMFNVVREAGVTEVAVAEGLVMYNPENEAILLEPGDGLRATGDGQTITLREVAPSAVGSWREGRLIYQHATLSEVARDLQRSTGMRITVAPAVSERRITAVVQLSDDPRQLAGRLERLLDIKVRQTEQGWILTNSG